MSYCINPKCFNPSDPKNSNQLYCVNCGSELILQQRYRVIQPLGKGGCGEVFEVDDNDTRKVIKCLNKKDPKIISLFQQEAKVLSRVEHSGIPKVEKNGGYFKYQPEGSKDVLHCLVMEKIEGLNLEEWLELRENKPIEEERAILWLSQLMEVLEKLHKNNYFHRDIKPSNIMLRNPQPGLPTEDRLVLIDFGAVREITDTYLAKIGGKKEGTGVHSAGYTPSEQINGRALPQSDFFALGRTFVYLLTGKTPIEFEEDDRLKLLWRDSAKHISKPLADLLDWLMEASPSKRPHDAEIIRQCLQQLQSGNGNFSWSIDENINVKSEIVKELQSASTVYLKPKWRGWQIAIFSSALATSLVMGVRYLGWLQPWEMSAFDRFMQMRPGEPIDPRVVVVEVTKEDVDKYNHNPLKDGQVAKVIQKIVQSKPRAIGLDIYRYEERPPGRKELISLFQKNDNLFIICSLEDKGKSFDPPRELSAYQLKSQVGFADLELDKTDSFIRRHLLSYNGPKFSPTSGCKTNYNFSFLLAYHFLEAENKKIINKNDDWSYNEVIFKALPNRYGGYQNIGESSQIMINYRSRFPQFSKFTLTQILENQVDPASIEDRIVLIGVNTSVVGIWGEGRDTPLGKMSAVWIHAHQISQILSAVLDNRRLIWVLPQWGDFQWGDAVFVWIWSSIGGMLAWYLRSLLKLILASGVAFLVSCGICLTILILGGWMPFVPSVLSLFSTVGLVVYIVFKYRKPQ